VLPCSTGNSAEQVPCTAIPRKRSNPGRAARCAGIPAGRGLPHEHRTTPRTHRRPPALTSGLMASEDAREGARAFAEKGAPCGTAADAGHVSRPPPPQPLSKVQEQ
jgi:hypothetical protein